MLKKLLRDFNLTDIQLVKLNKLRDICLLHNQQTNLTSITEEVAFNIKHILDSLSVLKFSNLNEKEILDVGSGAGFPGLVLAIVLEKSKITMLDANNKKINYLSSVIKELDIKNATTIHARAELANTREKYDVVISRAVAPLNILLELTSFSAKIGGRIILLKGKKVCSEIPNDWDVISKLGISFLSEETFKLEKNVHRKILFFIKNKSTDNNFPRSFSKIKMKPIY